MTRPLITYTEVYKKWFEENRQKLQLDYYNAQIDPEIQTFEEYCEDQYRYSG